MAKLSKTQQYAIRYLHSQNKTPQEISDELGVSLSQIKRIVKQTEEPQVKTAEAKTDKTKNLMIRQTSAKKQNTVSIMTEGASQLGDEFVKNIDYHKKRTEGYIFRPRD